MYAIILLLAQRNTSNWLYPSHLEAGISQDSIEYITYVKNDLFSHSIRCLVASQRTKLSTRAQKVKSFRRRVESQTCQCHVCWLLSNYV